MRRSRLLVVFALLGAALATSAGEAAAVATARPTDDSCPAGLVPEDGLVDVDPANAHEASIDCAVWWSLASGTTTTTFGPTQLLRREQMASFVARLLAALGFELPAAPPDAFADDAGSVHELRINQLAAVGVVFGNGGQYAPIQGVSRAQMLTFLVRAYELALGTSLPSGPDAFPDDDDSVHEPNIDKAAAAGFTGGRADGTFGPGGAVQRDQMASFLTRALDLGVEQGLAHPPSGDGTIDAESGGTVTSPDGRLVIQVPPGALTADTTISISIVPVEELRAEVRDLDELVLPVYRLEPAGLTFTQPVTITRRTPRADVPSAASGVPSVLGVLEPAGGGDAEWFGDMTHAVDGNDVVSTGTTTHFSTAYAFDGGVAVTLTPTSVTAAVNESWLTEIDVTSTTGSHPALDQALSPFASGAVDNVLGGKRFQCVEAGAGSFGFAVALSENTETASAMAVVFTGLGVEGSSSTAYPISFATCEGDEPEVTVTEAVVCASHSAFGAWASSLEWNIGFLFGEPTTAVDLSLLVEGMNDDAPVVVDLPPGPVIEVPVFGGIRSFGPKNIVHLTLLDGQGEVVIDLTQPLVDLVGPAPEVTASEGPIAGSGSCP